MSDTNSNQIDPQQMVDQLVQTGQVAGAAPVSPMGLVVDTTQVAQDLPMPTAPPAFAPSSFTPPSLSSPTPPMSLNLNQTLPTSTSAEPTVTLESPVLSTPPAASPVSSYVDDYAPPAETEAAPSIPPAIMEHQLPAVQEQSTFTSEKPMEEPDLEPVMAAVSAPLTPIVPTDSVGSSSPSWKTSADISDKLDNIVPLTPSSDTPPANSSSLPSDPAAKQSVAEGQTADQKPEVSQALEDQNIFHLLGIQEATDAEKEEFLDELQQIIWEDFVENDVELLLTQEELVDFKKIADKAELSEEDRQTEMIEFLEKLIPDLEKIMLEKALELKEEMMRERITELLGLYLNKPETLTKVEHARDLIDNQQWRTAADELNLIED